MQHTTCYTHQRRQLASRMRSCRHQRGHGASLPAEVVLESDATRVAQAKSVTSVTNHAGVLSRLVWYSHHVLVLSFNAGTSPLCQRVLQIISARRGLAVFLVTPPLPYSPLFSFVLAVASAPLSPHQCPSLLHHDQPCRQTLALLIQSCQSFLRAGSRSGTIRECLDSTASTF